jgi:hypothetical protein
VLGEPATAGWLLPWQQLQEGLPATPTDERLADRLAVDEPFEEAVFQLDGVCSGPSRVNRTSISLAWVGSGSYCLGR